MGGSELARAIAKTEDLKLVAAVLRKQAGRSLAEVLGEPLLTCRVYASAVEALAQPCDVFVEYTKPDIAKV
jgi:4-hydroxy-tetrahydrodipicolinate reductase